MAAATTGDMEAEARRRPQPALPRQGERSEQGVSSLELFFDLVFVFTLTQLTALLVADPSVAGAARVALVFAVLYWMYGGYVWLTNQARPAGATRQLLLFAGMAAFFVCALSIPTVFSGSGITFGLGYLAVVAVHGGLYAERYGRAVLRFTPFNMLGGVFVTLAAGVDGPVRYALWLSPVVLQYLAAALTRAVDEGRRAGFDIEPRHFAERHAGLVIVAFGESIAAVGIAMRALPLDPRTLAVAALGFVLTVCLWWLYFGGDDRRSEAALSLASLNDRVRMALNAYFYSYIALLIGVVVVAAGIRLSLGNLEARLALAPAVMLATGVAVFLLGDVAFRASLRLRPLRWRMAGIPLVLAASAPGVYLDGLAEIATLVLVVVALLGFEARGGRPSRAAGPRPEPTFS